MHISEDIFDSFGYGIKRMRISGRKQFNIFTRDLKEMVNYKEAVALRN